MFEITEGKVPVPVFAEITKKRLMESLEMIRRLRLNPLGKNLRQLEILGSVEDRTTKTINYFETMRFEEESIGATEQVYNFYCFAGNLTIVIGNFNYDRLDDALDGVNKQIFEFLVPHPSLV